MHCKGFKTYESAKKYADKVYGDIEHFTYGEEDYYLVYYNKRRK